ncbi:OprD family outer membrane porin [Sulfurimonas sp.]|uniref:OprD family outer membrane porin n=1 Tax=Sulfurimonas sp. TaxID=2022749 RepID=UPI003562915F
MKNTISSLMVLAVLLFGTSANATLKNDKITLKPSMALEYNKLPSSADTISEAFSNGMFYGRLRLNSFYWDWQNEDKAGSVKDGRAMGVGGSIIYKSAPLNRVSATVGLYTSQNPSFYRMDASEVSYLKAGKDTFSRYDTDKTGNFGMTVVGQAYLQYDIAKTSFYGGRQIFESVFTKSNDTKMIPNTFDGISAVIKDIPKTAIKLAYFASQKLRDHTVAHDVIAYNGWEENDDSGVNKNLTVARIGNNNSLSIVCVENKSIKNLKANISYAMVPDVVSNLALEAHYTIAVGGEWRVAPGIRYMQQFDNLGASYDVANLAGNHVGYNNARSLDSNLLALRLDVKNKAFLGRIGYSQIADEADIIAPWRGFPTGGFTRAMSQYNWYANTKTYMIRAGYDFSKAKLIPGFSIMARYAIQDFDNKKDGVQADSSVIHIDARQNIGKNLEAKVRLGFVNMDDSILKSNGVDYKSDTSYNEYRFELNYFF